MDGTSVFLIEVVATLALSGVIAHRLRHLMRRIGAESCERGAGSTEFWVTYTQLMMFIAPLMLLAFVSRAGSTPAPTDVAQIKSSFLAVLSGQFIALALIGRAVWKSLVAAKSAAVPSPKADERGVPL